MGANTSKSAGKLNKSSVCKPKMEDSVDLGAVFPNGLYPTTEQDFDPRAVKSLIIARKISPFYKGLPDAPEPVTDIRPTLLPPPTPPMPSLSEKTNSRPRSASTSRIHDPYIEKQRIYIEKMKKIEETLFNDAVECPICFLYYPPNINYSRCCDQPICTECFVQIHRPIETPSIPATCPFCMQENYGITYEAPSWSEKFQARSRSGSHSTMTGTRHTTSGIGSSEFNRRECVSHKDPDVVLVDHIRPNWDKANVVPPASSSRPVSRRNSASAGSRNFLRAAGLLTRPGRSASSAAATEYNQFLSNIRDVNMDLEDWMVMEAIRLSLAEQEEHQRKERSRPRETPSGQE
ncbi:hypothetical protein BY458DRAFT_507378 [Sporodiniella umbellata]|nr:hypothetical protein BY458DRAFT_507378 [Sporodiniella umbellata]